MSNGDSKISDRYPVPPGFRSLLEALAREVLRNQPTDIYAFSSLFFERLTVYRKENGSVPTLGADEYNQFKRDLHEAAIRENLLANRGQRSSSKMPAAADVQKPAGSDEPECTEEQAAIRIQAAFRGHKSRAGQPLPRADSQPDMNISNSAHSLSGVDEEKAAARIQAEVRGLLARKKYNQMKKEMDGAAITIQKQFRGFKARQAGGGQLARTMSQGQMPASNSANSLGSEPPMVLDGTEDEQRAALAIQRNFKGFKVRKELKEEQEAAKKIQRQFRDHMRKKDDEEDLK